ncbi:ABC transporter permease [Elioraea tepidiphila]|jgi:peptide/nickel transport system permease protein|uniref:ABC transporter permease n=1 Tax=Elioraea tepidiphila TaxID=457934 RepID=UPI00037BC36B|nr:ABC transporter permease [Elioraea tepidiphila]
MRLAAPVLRQLLTAGAIGVLVFLLMRVIPGDVVDVLGIEGDLTEAEQQALRIELGLDAGWGTQFLRWVGGALAGDLGLSLRYNRPVAEMIGYALPHTLTLAALALGLGLALGVSVAAVAAARPSGVWPGLVQVLNVWSIALPTFCVGLAGILVFSIWLGWLPVRGQILMPVLVLGIDIAGQIAKPLHEELKEILATPFIRSARAKGLGPGAIVLRHVLPNAAGVLSAVSGLILAGLVSGALTMEVLFGLPGLGSLAFQAIAGRDWTVLQSVVVLFALGVIVANLLADLAHRLADPRVR